MKIAVVLDNVRSVHNVGSVFRTADAVGATNIYCCGITPGPLDRFKNIRADFAKVSLGAERSVVWEMAESTSEVIERLKKDQWNVFVVEQSERSIPYYEWKDSIKPNNDPNPKVALVLGTETDGIGGDLLAACDAILEIPMRGKKESLNVAVAFGIVAFTIAFPGVCTKAEGVVV